LSGKASKGSRVFLRTSAQKHETPAASIYRIPLTFRLKAEFQRSQRLGGTRESFRKGSREACDG
jgi:hypothetical protein